MKRSLPRNASCPCNSGRKYKRCCLNKGFTYVVDEEDSIFREVPVSEEVAQAFRELKWGSAGARGRERGPQDPALPELPHSEDLEHQIAEVMRAAEVDPALIYAFEKTGRLVSEASQHLVAPDELDEWYAAVEEHERKAGAAECASPGTAARSSAAASSGFAT
ncbi:SEC-C domain-containing protein [Planctomycetota bacterium]